MEYAVFSDKIRSYCATDYYEESKQWYLMQRKDKLLQNNVYYYVCIGLLP